MSFSSLAPLAAAEPASGGLETIATPTLWAVTIVVVLGLLVVDFIATRKPHEVSMREATLWSIFYIALPVAFGGYVLAEHGSESGVNYYTGYIVEKSLSVDNLFVFMLLLSAFAVPKVLQQRVLLFGIIGALVLRGIFIALGAAALSAFTIVFLLFGLILLATGAKLLRDALRGESEEAPDPNEMRVVKVLRRFWPVTEDYQGTRMTVKQAGRRALTPLALVTVAVFMTDIVFAVDSVPAALAISSNRFVVYSSNALAILGLRSLYLLLEHLIGELKYLHYGLAAVLLFSAVKLATSRWLHISPAISIGIILVCIGAAIWPSLRALRRMRRIEALHAPAP